jgi:hypothetical protein
MADKAWKEAIIEVLSYAGASMTRAEIAEAIVSKGLRQKVGATPANTVVATITSSMSNEGAETPFVRVGRGEYALKSIVDSGDKSELDKAPESDEEATGGVNAFGIYWSRSLVNWRSPKLMGQQQIGANTVDLSQQIGVYLLYDGREVVYVGRSVDRPINQRLLEHTRDRLQARWNRFSWFGLYPVTENGKLITESPPLDCTALIRTLEAVLIESMEPGQNRKRGDIFSSIEYIQVIDPKIEENNKRSLLEELLEGVKAR